MDEKKKPEVVNVDLADILGGEESGMSFEVVETKVEDEKKEEKKE